MRKWPSQRDSELIECRDTAWRKIPCWSYHVGRWIVNETTWRTIAKLLKSVFENQTMESEFSVFEFWGQFGLVKFLENWYPTFSSVFARPCIVVSPNWCKLELGVAIDYWLMGSCIHAFNRYWNWWPWMAPVQVHSIACSGSGSNDIGLVENRDRKFFDSL